MRRPSLDTDKLHYRGILFVANGVLLVIGGYGMAVMEVARYHPNRAGDPLYGLPFWQRGLCFALFLGLLEVLILVSGNWGPRQAGSGQPDELQRGNGS